MKTILQRRGEKDDSFVEISAELQRRTKVRLEFLVTFAHDNNGVDNRRLEHGGEGNGDASAPS